MGDDMPRGTEPGQPKAKKQTGGSGRWSKYEARQSEANPHWDECDMQAISATVQAVTSDGDAVLFGQSADGGVLVLTVCSGSDRRKFYAKSADEMNSHMHTVTSLYTD